MIPGNTKQFKNSLGFIPCVEIFNNPQGLSMEGVGEFDVLWPITLSFTHDD
jgi:hypothetical protein